MPHLIVLFVVALVIFGPQKLPELARMLGKATAEFRKMTGDFRYALEEEVRELERQTRIREAEAAAAASRPQTAPVETTPEKTPIETPPAEPQGTVPRVEHSIGGTEPAAHLSELQVESAPVVETPPDARPDPTAAPDSATSRHQKDPDDNAAA